MCEPTPSQGVGSRERGAGLWGAQEPNKRKMNNLALLNCAHGRGIEVGHFQEPHYTRLPGYG